MKIKVGGIYKTRDGRKADIQIRSTNGKVLRGFVENEPLCINFNENGKCRIDGARELDIVSEWVDPRLEVAIDALERMNDSDYNNHIVEEALNKIKEMK